MVTEFDYVAWLQEPAAGGGLLDLSDEELENEIAKRQPQQPVDLSQLSDEDLQRELSKRQLATEVAENIVDP